MTRFLTLGVALCCLAGGALLANAGRAAAQSQPHEIQLATGSARQASIPAGQSITINVDRDLGEIVVGDPEVADVAPLSRRSLYVLGKGPGRTTVSVYDSANTPIGVIQIEVGVDVSDLAAAIRQHLPNARVRASTVNGRLRLAGVVQNGQALSVVLDLAKQYAGDNFINALEVTDSQQVSLEVRFIEVSRTAGRELGVNLAITDPNRAARGLVTGDVGFATGTDPITGDVRFQPGLQFPNAGTGSGDLSNAIFQATGSVPFATLITRVLSGGVNADLFIRALEGKGLARRLAEPNLTALSGQTANFLAGGEVPITRQTDDDLEIVFKEFGVRLEFTPIVLDNGLINVKLKPEVSQVDPTIIVNGNPGFVTRKAETTVELRDGQSFAIAGLLQTISEKDQRQIPWIGQIPVLGTLFRSSSFTKRETDLVVIVTPRIVRPAKPGEKLASPLDDSRNSNDIEFFLLGMAEIDDDFIRKIEAGDGIMGPFGHIIDLKFGDDYAAAKK